MATQRVAQKLAAQDALPPPGQLKSGATSAIAAYGPPALETGVSKWPTATLGARVISRFVPPRVPAIQNA